jgi:ferredoxin
MNNNLAFIDSDKCKLCRKCVVECPTNAIIELGFPPRKIKTDLPPKPAEKKEAPVKPEVKASEDTKPDNSDQK